MIPAPKHLAHLRAIRLEVPAQWQGAGCRNFSRLPARGEAFSLDILFYRTRDVETFTASRRGHLREIVPEEKIIEGKELATVRFAK